MNGVMGIKFGRLHDLDYAVGLVFPANEQPEDTSGTTPCPVEKGSKVARFYLPPQDINDMGDCANYKLPPGMKVAAQAEIVLKPRQSEDIQAVTLAFKFKPDAFGFGESPYLRLLVLREGCDPQGEQIYFEPLYIKVRKVGGEEVVYSLDVMWNRDEISVFIDKSSTNEAPRCLRKSA